MTIAERLKEEGRLESKKAEIEISIEKGKSEGKLEIAKKC